MRENENRARETDELRLAMELSNQALGEAIERESNDSKQRLSHAMEDLRDEAKSARKDLKDKMDTDANDLKRKIEMETNEIRYDDVIKIFPLPRAQGSYLLGGCARQLHM